MDFQTIQELILLRKLLIVQNCRKNLLKKKIQQENGGKSGKFMSLLELLKESRLRL